MAYARALREKLGRIGADIQAIISLCEKEDNRGLNADERTKFHALEADFTALEDSIKVAEQSDKFLARLGTPGGPAKIDETNLEQVQDELRLSNAQKRQRDKDPHARAFSTYLRHGMNALDDEARRIMAGLCVDPNATAQMSSFRNVMSTTTSSQGGYIVPSGFSGMLEEAKKWFGGIDGVVDRFLTETGNPWPWPTLNDTANKGRIIGQNVQVTETDLVFGQVTFGAYIGSSDLILIPLALMEDAYFDLDALVARLLGTRLGRLYNYECTLGTGTNEPTGLVTAAIAAGSVNTFPTGETAAIAYNDLVNVEHTVDPAYRYNDKTRFMFNDTQLKLLKKLVDASNRPLWQPGLTASFREGASVDLQGKPTILNHPYVINQDMASPAANAYSMLFGDMSAFKVRELRSGTTVLRLVERYADYLQVGFIAFQRFDSNLIDAGTHPIAAGRNSAT